LEIFVEVVITAWTHLLSPKQQHQSSEELLLKHYDITHAQHIWSTFFSLYVICAGFKI